MEQISREFEGTKVEFQRDCLGSVSIFKVHFYHIDQSNRTKHVSILFCFSFSLLGRSKTLFTSCTERESKVSFILENCDEY